MKLKIKSFFSVQKIVMEVYRCILLSISNIIMSFSVYKYDHPQLYVLAYAAGQSCYS
jgi:hypothetical protein